MRTGSSISVARKAPARTAFTLCGGASEVQGYVRIDRPRTVINSVAPS
jgi:hypothetical protein